MPNSQLGAKQIGELATLVAQYIAQQRSEFSRTAHSIDEKYKQTLTPFFPSDVLDKVRVVRGRVKEPSFYPQLRKMGIDHAPPFADMAGITFEDVVVHVEPLSESLLFHELVHAVQYKHLGVNKFARLYTRGFFEGGSYEEIPLEKQAYALEARFVAQRTVPFSVEAEVERSLQLGLL